MRFVPADPNFEARVRESFARQRLMATIGARLTRVEPGEVEIELPFREDLTQQDGYLHAGVVTAIADSACGYAAYTLMPAGSRVLSVEYKVNLLSPAKGVLMRSVGVVKKPGRTLIVCAGDVSAHTAEGSAAVATMLATMMMLLEKT
jgi:uncharacterized protein (TIGR00369 family)